MGYRCDLAIKCSIFKDYGSVEEGNSLGSGKTLFLAAIKGTQVL